MMDDDPRTLIRQANLHRQGGRLEAAVETYQRLLRRWPQLPDSWYNLALLQRQLGWPAQALDAYQWALDHGIAQPEEVHLNRGVIYADDLRQPDAAERELDTALALNPRYVPALLNRANLCEDRGQRDAALAWYERLLSLDPGCHEALARYASLLGAASAGDPIIGRLQQAIADPAVLAAEKASLGFALGKLLDGCAAYDGAFAAYRQANEHSRASLGAGRALYDRTAHEHFVDSLIRAFARPRACGGTAMAPPPIFVCGMFRSGSTLVEQVLAGHSQVRAGGELGLLPTLVQTRLAPYPARMAQLGAADLAAIGQQYLAAASALRGDAARITDKRPDNYLHIGLIKTLFPDAKIVHTRRHPLDNGLSIYFLHLDPQLGYALDLADIGHHYREYQRLMAHWRSIYADDILDFDYDAFVRDPRPAVQRLLQFCGLPWEEGCMAFERVPGPVRTASVWQVRQPLYGHASGRWRHYTEHLDPLRQALGGSPVSAADAASR